MNLPSLYIKPKILIAIALVLLGVPITVFLVSQNQNLIQKANESPYPACAPDVPPSGWPECRYGLDTYNKQACRNKAENFKGISGPGDNAPDSAWFTWAQDPPKPLSCGTACGLAPSFCITSNTPTPEPTNTPKPPTNTPKPPTNTPKPPTLTPIPPSITPEPTATDIPPTPTEVISSCPIPETPEGGLNVKIDCPYCGD